MNINYSYNEMKHMFAYSETYKKINSIVQTGKNLERQDFPSTIKANKHHLANTLVAKISKFEYSDRVAYWTFSPEEAEIIEIFHKEANTFT